MKSQGTPPAWEIFAGDKVSVEIPLLSPVPNSTVRHFRGDTKLTSLEIQFLEQSHLHLQQSQILYLGLRPGLCPIFSSTHTQDLGSLSWRYFQRKRARGKFSFAPYLGVSFSKTGKVLSASVVEHF